MVELIEVELSAEGLTPKGGARGLTSPVQEDKHRNVIESFGSSSTGHSRGRSRQNGLMICGDFSFIFSVQHTKEIQ